MSSTESQYGERFFEFERGLLRQIDKQDEIENYAPEKCEKPNCRCIEIECLKQGTDQIKNYPCLSKQHTNEANSEKAIHTL